jgi:hypothetical protein
MATYAVLLICILGLILFGVGIFIAKGDAKSFITEVGLIMFWTALLAYLLGHTRLPA